MGVDIPLSLNSRILEWLRLGQGPILLRMEKEA